MGIAKSLETSFLCMRSVQAPAAYYSRQLQNRIDLWMITGDFEKVLISLGLVLHML